MCSWQNTQKLRISQKGEGVIDANHTFDPSSCGQARVARQLVDKLADLQEMKLKDSCI